MIRKSSFNFCAIQKTCAQHAQRAQIALASLVCAPVHVRADTVWRGDFMRPASREITREFLARRRGLSHDHNDDHNNDAQDPPTNGEVSNKLCKIVKLHVHVYLDREKKERISLLHLYIARALRVSIISKVTARNRDDARD